MEVHAKGGGAERIRTSAPVSWPIPLAGEPLIASWVLLHTFLFLHFLAGNRKPTTFQPRVG